MMMMPTRALHGPGGPAWPDRAGPGCKIFDTNWARPGLPQIPLLHWLQLIALIDISDITLSVWPVSL